MSKIVEFEQKFGQNMTKIKKECFPKKFYIVTNLQQNVSNRGGDGDGGCDGGDCDGLPVGGGGDGGGDSSGDGDNLIETKL